MENMMKRTISALMALVLVLGMLPGVPMFAGAEEVETLPETVAAETTEAAAVPVETEVPETTAAPETQAPETVPETTAGEEPVPETTEAETQPAETVPEETIPAETVPEETAPEETLVEETVPEVSEEPADANDTIVIASGIKVSAAREETYLGRDVKLTVTFTPSDVTDTEVEWHVGLVSTDEAGNEIYDENGVPEACGVFEAPATGEVYLRVPYDAENNYSGVYGVWASQVRKDEEGTVLGEIVSDPVEVTFYRYEMEINQKAISEENTPEEDKGYFILQTGDSMDISVAYKRWIGNETPEIKLPLHTACVEWDVEVVIPTAFDAEGDPVAFEKSEEDPSKYVSWSGREDTKELTLKAKLVTEYKFIRVRAHEVGENNTPIGDSSIIIRLYPDSYKLYVTYEDENGEIIDATKAPIVLDLANGEKEVELTAIVWPEEGDEKLEWSTSDSMVELLPDENLEETDKDYDNYRKVVADERSGETVITIQGKEHPGVYATVTIQRVRLIQELYPTKASEELETKELMVGKSAQLQAHSYNDREIVDNALLKWELGEGDEAYATISDKGVLTAQNVTEGKVITVRCSVINNEENAYFELYIPIRPKATAVKILSDSFPELEPGEVINGKTILVDTELYEASVPAVLVEDYVEPYASSGDPVGARQEVTWKSSNTSVAYFDKLTDKLIWKGKNGTTTITATTKDGTNKSASVKLQFGAKLKTLTIEGTEDMFLRSGSSWTFGLSYTPENAINKSVTWSVKAMDKDGGFTADASAIATISSGGKLTAKTVYDNHMVRVFAVSKEDASVSAYFDVLIRPKQDGALTIRDDDGKCVTKTTIMKGVEDAFFLEAVFVGEELGEYGDSGATWKSSNTAVATVDDGWIETFKVGSATITAKSSDGKTATVTIKVVSWVDSIEISEKKLPENDEGTLATGKSLDMTAKVFGESGNKPTISKITWHIKEGEQYATINSSGKVTAAKEIDFKDQDYVTVVIYAKATDGSDTESNEYCINIHPAVTAMRIDLETDEAMVNTGSYTHYLAEAGETVGTLTAVTFPTKASDEVTWKSSNAKIAEVDEYNNLIVHKAGSVTITATATDGTNKKATFKLKIVNKIARMEWNNDANELIPDQEFAIAGGKSISLKPVFYGVDGKKMTVPVEWDIDIVDETYGTAFDRFNKGTIVAAKVTSPKFVTVTIRIDEAYAEWAGFELDNEGKASTTVQVGVYPATKSLQIVECTDSGYRTTNEIWKKAGCDEFNLAVLTDPADAADGWTWKSSNTSIAEVTADGRVIPNCERDPKTGKFKAGTVTITATAKDGTGKKDTIKIVFAN